MRIIVSIILTLAVLSAPVCASAYTLFFYGQKTTQTINEVEVEGYMLGEAGSEKFFPVNKVLYPPAPVTYGGNDLFIIQTDNQQWFKKALSQSNYLGKSYTDMIMRSQQGVSPAAVAKLMVRVRYTDGTRDENDNLVVHNSSVQVWEDAGKPGVDGAGVLIEFTPPVSIFGVDID